MFPFSMPGESHRQKSVTDSDRGCSKSEQVPWWSYRRIQSIPSPAALLASLSEPCLPLFPSGGCCTSEEGKVYHSGFLRAVAITDCWCLCFGRQHPSCFVPSTTLLVPVACPVMLIRLQGRSSILHFLLRQGFNCGENSTLLSLIIHIAVLCGYS